MTTPDPQLVRVAEQVAEKLCACVVGAHPQGRGRRMLPILLDALTAVIAQEREACAKVIELAEKVIPNVPTEVMRTSPRPVGGSLMRGFADLKEAIASYRARAQG